MTAIMPVLQEAQRWVATTTQARALAMVRPDAFVKFQRWWEGRVVTKRRRGQAIDQVGVAPRPLHAPSLDAAHLAFLTGLAELLAAIVVVEVSGCPGSRTHRKGTEITCGDNVVASGATEQQQA